MKKLLIYYFIAFVPFILLIYAGSEQLISKVWFLILLFVYAFVYRNITDYYRLRSKQIQVPHPIQTMFFPGLQYQYFWELYTI